MTIIRNMAMASFAVTVMPFYGDIFTAIAQLSVRSLISMLLPSLGMAL